MGRMANACLLAALAATPAWAEDPVPDFVRLSPEDLLLLDPSVTGEAIEVWGERPDKPFDRDTELRLSGEELRRRGATNLAEAIDLLPDVVVREQGRGGKQIEVRGARRGSVKILIDGMSINDPYYGNFDISSIPVTDIVQIRVSTSPASPIDGVGGPGGVIEVHTRDAVGPRLVSARVQNSSLPSTEAAATGRAMLTETLAMRVSASGALGMRDYPIRPPGQRETFLAEDRQQAVGAVRLEYREGSRRIVADGWAQRGGYVVPPGEDGSDQVLVIDGETQLRAGIMADDQLRRWRLQARAYGQYLARDSRYYRDATLDTLARREDLEAIRIGGALLGNRALGARTHVISSAVVDFEEASVLGFDRIPVLGQTGILEVASGLQFADGPIELDGALGMAAPFGIDAAFWPEAKLRATYRPIKKVSLELIGGRKGRLPTLRERFRPDIGNEELGPEHVWFSETRVEHTPTRWLRTSVGAYLRRSSGLILFDAERAALRNTGQFDIRGVDALAELAPAGPVGGGASWSFTDAISGDLGADALDFLPRHRTTAWVTARRARFGGTARVRHQTRQIDRNAVLAPYTVLDLSAWAALPAGLMGTLRLDNATSTDYEIRSGIPAPGPVVTLVMQGEWK
jgi:hypothetical protein